MILLSVLPSIYIVFIYVHIHNIYIYIFMYIYIYILVVSTVDSRPTLLFISLFLANLFLGSVTLSVLGLHSSLPVFSIRPSSSWFPAPTKCSETKENKGVVVAVDSFFGGGSGTQDGR